MERKKVSMKYEKKKIQKWLRIIFIFRQKQVCFYNIGILIISKPEMELPHI